MNKPLSGTRSRHPEGHHRPDGGLAKSSRCPMRRRTRLWSHKVPVRSGPYTDNDVAIDVEKGLKRARIAWVKERGGVEGSDGRRIRARAITAMRPASASRAISPNTPRPLRADSPSPVGEGGVVGRRGNRSRRRRQNGL